MPEASCAKQRGDVGEGDGAIREPAKKAEKNAAPGSGPGSGQKRGKKRRHQPNLIPSSPKKSEKHPGGRIRSRNRQKNRKKKTQVTGSDPGIQSPRKSKKTATPGPIASSIKTNCYAVTQERKRCLSGTVTEKSLRFRLNRSIALSSQQREFETSATLCRRRRTKSDGAPGGTILPRSATEPRTDQSGKNAASHCSAATWNRCRRVKCSPLQILHLAGAVAQRAERQRPDHSPRVQRPTRRLTHSVRENAHFDLDRRLDEAGSHLVRLPDRMLRNARSGWRFI